MNVLVIRGLRWTETMNFTTLLHRGTAAYQTRPEVTEMTITFAEGGPFHLVNNFLNDAIVNVHGARRRCRQLFPVLEARVVRQSMPSVESLASPSQSVVAWTLAVHVFIFGCCGQETVLWVSSKVSQNKNRVSMQDRNLPVYLSVCFIPMTHYVELTCGTSLSY